MQEMPSSGSEKRKVNNSLSSTLFNYVIPFFSQKYIVKEENIAKNKKRKNIKEQGIKKEKGRLEILLLEELILSKINKKEEKGKGKIKVKRQINDVLDEFENIGKINKNNGKIDYLLELTKENIGEKPYSVSIKYEENSEEEKLDITIKLKDYSLNKLNNKNIEKDKEEIYSISIANKKGNKDKIGYSLKISYEDNYQQERLTIDYKGNISRYQKRREESLQDFSDRVPGKFVNVLPHSIMGGILGFTYLGENFMGKREDMVGNKMVDVHESIHTDNEYETRVLTSWILSRERQKYIR